MSAPNVFYSGSKVSEGRQFNNRISVVQAGGTGAAAVTCGNGYNNAFAPIVTGLTGDLPGGHVPGHSSLGEYVFIPGGMYFSFERLGMVRNPCACGVSRFVVVIQFVTPGITLRIGDCPVINLVFGYSVAAKIR